MKLIREITNKDVGVPNKEKLNYRLRKATRTVLFDNQGKIAVLFVSKHKYHKIPGGGLEQGENIKQALTREIKEETGCTATIKGEVGLIIEYKDNSNIIQISYCYISKLKKYGTPDFTDSERSEGFQLQWMTLDEAIKTITKEKPDLYHAKFKTTRDLAFLKETKKILSK
jgi:ADP-ribose pyrophosphatase YjhB (NUDIX family)